MKTIEEVQAYCRHEGNCPVGTHPRDRNYVLEDGTKVTSAQIQELLGLTRKTWLTRLRAWIDFVGERPAKEQ